MLAWIFWHTRFEHVPPEDYISNLHAFHARITSASPDGFLGSRILRYDAVPWLPSATEIYEDWYFMKDSCALDRLDEAAIAAFSQQAHGNIARLAATATSGLYRLRAGKPLDHPSHVTWINKPRGEPYDSFIASVAHAGAVWSRQMVLGPTPEFCVESAEDPKLSVPSMFTSIATPVAPG